MPEETTLEQPLSVLPPNSPPHPCTVCSKQRVLSPQEIKRINIAFIKLLLAKETHQSDNSDTDVSTQTAR